MVGEAARGGMDGEAAGGDGGKATRAAEASGVATAPSASVGSMLPLSKWSMAAETLSAPVRTFLKPRPRMS